MRTLLNYILCCAFLVGLPSLVEAQTLREYEKSANKMLAQGDSVGALGIYRQAFDGVEQLLDGSARIRMAELAEGLKYYTIAKQQYAVVADSDQADKYKNVRLKLAEAQRRTGAYDAAKSNYERVLTVTKDTACISACNRGLAEADWALSRVTQMDSVEVVQLPQSVNTNNSEFAGNVFKDDFYFSRLGLADYKNREKGTTTSVFRINDLEIDTVALRIGLDSTTYVAHFAANATGDQVVYTVCEAVKIAEYRCDLYTAKVLTNSKGEITFGNGTKMDGPINLAGYHQTNPSLGTDEVTGDALLFFASNRPNGEGKMDLWMSRAGADGKFSTPTNLGFANTNEDDVTPYFHTPTQSLFFSSKGHETLGGFDINRVSFNSGNWGEVVGLRAPINSTFDDTYYALIDSPSRTYFSSNRPGATCEAKEIQECCGFDLYKVDLDIALEVLTFDGMDSTMLAETTVTLYDIDSGEEIVRFTDASNLAQYPVDLGRNYRLIASRPGYGNDTLEFDTKDIYQPTLITKSMYLPPLLTLELYTFNSISRDPLTSVRVEFAELGGLDTTIRLDKNSNMYSFPVLYGKSYRAYGSRGGFNPDMEIIATGKYAGTGKVIRDSLYLAPFAPLPLVLYFDNDHPNPNTTDMNTSLAYSETVGPYLSRKPKFMKFGTVGQGNTTSSNMESFFNEVNSNHQKLLEFSGILVKYLAEGNEIDIIIEGYASPLAKSKYNEALTSRRTRSIINHFTQWEKGALLPFLETGQLRIKQEPLGENQAPTDINDSPANRKYSEFGLKASRERKVRITDIQRREELPLSQVPRNNPIETQTIAR
ncbi:MAG: hypothetical protein AB8F78_19605 [Saprospiraceae bacterium]